MSDGSLIDMEDKNISEIVDKIVEILKEAGLSPEAGLSLLINMVCGTLRRVGFSHEESKGCFEVALKFYYQEKI